MELCRSGCVAQASFAVGPSAYRTLEGSSLPILGMRPGRCTSHAPRVASRQDSDAHPGRVSSGQDWLRSALAVPAAAGLWSQSAGQAAIRSGDSPNPHVSGLLRAPTGQLTFAKPPSQRLVSGSNQDAIGAISSPKGDLTKIRSRAGRIDRRRTANPCGRAARRGPEYTGFDPLSWTIHSRRQEAMLVLRPEKGRYLGSRREELAVAVWME